METVTTTLESDGAAEAAGGAGGSFAGEAAETMVGHYRMMVLIRAFEERTAEMYQRAKIGGYCHLNLGEEATIVGLMEAMSTRDYLFTNYREHGYALARRIDPGRVMAELFGKETGVSRGRGGSMHLFDVATRLYGGYAIVGGQIPLATGAALAITYRHSDEVVMCQLGDGTTNIGAFHECLNLAQLWRLPIVYVVVNNRLGMGTTVEQASAEPELYRRASAYRMHSERVDGDDILAVRDAATRAVKQAREEHLPTLLETTSYRLRGHSVVDPARYRSKDDVAESERNDPIPAFRLGLVAAGILDDRKVAKIAAEVERQVSDAVAFADAGPDPRAQDLFAYAYATPVANAPAAFPGDPLTARPAEEGSR
jgi:pyruvate dehydrogenase E1 component alpha subunit